MWPYRNGGSSILCRFTGAADGTVGQINSGSSNLLPGMYRLRATIKLATSEIAPRDAVQAPQN